MPHIAVGGLESDLCWLLGVTSKEELLNFTTDRQRNAALLKPRDLSVLFTLLFAPIGTACDGQDEEACSPSSLITAGQETVQRCVHSGPEARACCSLLAARFDMERGCQGRNEVLACALSGSATSGTSCGFPTSVGCYVKEGDGVTEYWLTPALYDQFPNSSEILGELGDPCDQAMTQQLIAAPACP